MSVPRLLITRPDEEQERTVRAARSAGFEPVPAPLLRVEGLPFDLPAELPPALLFTSARAPAPAARRFPALRSLPAYAVGAHTATAVRMAGFSLRDTGVADGNAIVAAAHASGETRLLHIAGEDSAPLDIPAGISIERRVAYRAVAAESLPDAAIAALRGGALVLLLSPRTAEIFARLSDSAGLDRGRTGIATISAAAATAAGSGWRDVEVAASPDLKASLAAARLLWQKQIDA